MNKSLLFSAMATIATHHANEARNPTMNQNQQPGSADLPPLPKAERELIELHQPAECTTHVCTSARYTAEHMRQYAREAIAASRRAAQPVAPVGGALVAMPEQMPEAVKHAIERTMDWSEPASIYAAIREAFGERHPDDLAVDRFAAAMKSKMTKSRAKGRGGWDDPAQCSVETLQDMLLGHLAKGDPVDIGNFAMMLFSRGAPVAAPAGALVASTEPIGCVVGASPLDGAMPENEKLRQILAATVTGHLLYCDDGELQDNTVRPWIDFKRDPADEIFRKLVERALAAPTESAAAPADLEQLMIEHRIGLTPENEGGFHAYVYRESEMYESSGYGTTPSEAVKAALATHQPIPTKGNDTDTGADRA